MDMAAVLRELPEALRRKLEGRTVTLDHGNGQRDSFRYPRVGYSDASELRVPRVAAAPTSALAPSPTERSTDAAAPTGACASVAAAVC